MKPSRRAAASAPPAAGHTEPFRGSFVGREADVAAIEGLLREGACLVTLLGPGGVGKTRLLHRLIRQLASAYKSTLWCDLSTARSPADVISGVAGAVSGIAPGAARTGTAAIERVGRALARRGPCLLALDNLEQLQESALPPLARWIGEAPSLVVLVTSRVRLGIAGEVVHHVGPLSLTAGAAGSSDALRLFEDRAEAVRAGFSPEERASAARIVALLDGIPLAIEMAATRLCVLAPAELLERLSRPLAVLASTARADPDRHASLSRLLDDSWELLGEVERRALAELGVFVGGFTIESAEAVLSSGPGAVAALQRLIDSSLVRGVASRTPRKRNAPYEIVREYALERLADNGQLSAARLRHAVHFAAWGEARIAQLAERSLDELVDEEANLSGAVEFVRSLEGDARAGALHLRLLAALGPVRMLRGQLDEWASHLALALASTPHEEPALRAPVQLALARALHELGRADAAVAAYEGAIAVAREAQAASLQGLALAGYGRLIAALGEWERACGLFAEARALPGATEAVRKLANACYEYYGGELDSATHDEPDAIADYVQECRGGADPCELAFWLVQLGRIEGEGRRADREASTHFKEALSLTRRLGDLRGEGFALKADIKGPALASSHVRWYVRPMHARRLLALSSLVFVFAVFAGCTAEQAAGGPPTAAPPVTPAEVHGTFHFLVDHDGALTDVDKIVLTDRFTTRLDGLPPGTEVTVVAQMRLPYTPGRGWRSDATFTADAQGAVDSGAMAPLRGSYSGVDPDGLVWSMQKGPLAGGSPFDRGGNVSFTATVDDVVVAERILVRTDTADNVTMVPVDDNGLVGEYFVPAGAVDRIPIVAFGGSDGGIDGGRTYAMRMASFGHPSLALAYFGAPGIPQKLQGVPLEYFAKAFAWLDTRTETRKGKAVVMGGSRGGELALLLGAAFPNVVGVVAETPSSFVWAGLGERGEAAWTFGGKPLPFVPASSLSGPESVDAPNGNVAWVMRPAFEGDLARATPVALEAARIAVEKIQGPILMLAGDADQMWPACDFVKRAMDHLTENGHVAKYGDEAACFAGAGHDVMALGWPTGDSMWADLGFGFYSLGGTAAANAHAGRSGDDKVRAFLARVTR